MLEVILVPVIFLLILGFFAFALHFSRYKQQGRGSCGRVDCCKGEGGETHHNNHSCYSSKIDYMENEIPKLKKVNS